MNEARTLAALGAKVRLVSKLGEDAAGEMILGRCRDLGIDTEFIRRSAEIPTGVNIVLIDEAGRAAVYYQSSRHPCGSSIRKTFPGRPWREERSSALPVFLWAPAFTAPVLAELFSQA